MLSQLQKFRCCRGLHTSSSRKMEVQSKSLVEKLKTGPPIPVSKFYDMPKCKVKMWEKPLLVVSGRFETLREVPDYIEYEILHTFNQWKRVKRNFLIITFAVLLNASILYAAFKDYNDGVDEWLALEEERKKKINK